MAEISVNGEKLQLTGNADNATSWSSFKESRGSAGATDEDSAAAQLALALAPKESPARKVGAKLSNRVKECIEAVPMSKGMDWAEYSRHAYKRFGRDKAYGCACGANLFGASGLCRICGKYQAREKLAKGPGAPNLCWTGDLYELCRPLLDPDVTLNHSEQQYALRAVTQRMKAPPWDWNGPDKPLKSAVDAGAVELVFVMLQAGMDPDEADKKGVTALHDAVFAGRMDVCRILLEGCAKVDPRDRHGQTPLFFAATSDICELLCERQADITAVNSKGQSALHLAARAGLREVVDWLSQRCNALEHKVKSVVSQQDSHGATAQQYLMISAPEADPQDVATISPALRASRLRRSKSERRWNTRTSGRSSEEQDESGRASKSSNASRPSSADARKRSFGSRGAKALAIPDKQASRVSGSSNSSTQVQMAGQVSHEGTSSPEASTQHMAPDNSMFTCAARNSIDELDGLGLDDLDGTF